MRNSDRIPPPYPAQRRHISGDMGMPVNMMINSFYNLIYIFISVLQVSPPGTMAYAQLMLPRYYQQNISGCFINAKPKLV